MLKLQPNLMLGFFLSKLLHDSYNYSIITSIGNVYLSFNQYRRYKMKEDNSIKSFSIRLPKHLWFFLRKNSVDVELSMNQIIVDCIKSYKDKNENKLDNTI